MHREGSFGYFNGGTFQALEIPYKSKELSMFIFLPKERKRSIRTGENLTAANMQQWLRQLAPVPKVIVTLPKFK